MSLDKETQQASETRQKEIPLEKVGLIYLQSFDNTKRQFHPWLLANTQTLHAARRNPTIYQSAATINDLVDEARAAIDSGNPTEDDIRLMKGLTLYRLFPTVGEVKEVVGDFATANELRNKISLDPYNRSKNAWRRSFQIVGDVATRLEEYGWRPDQPSMLDYYSGQKVPGAITSS